MKAALTLSAALLVAGCVAGPDYHGPQATIAQTLPAQGAFVAGDDSAFAQEPLPDRWWSLYADPRLDALVEQALAVNADLRAADANLRKAEAVLRQTAGARAISTGVSVQAAQERDYSTTSAGASMPGVATYGLGLSASYPLDLAGKLRRAIEAGEADRDAVAAARDTVRIGVAAAVARAYAGVCAANFQMATAQRVAGLQRRTLDATIRLARGGRGTAFDVTRARTAVETSEAALPAFVAKRQASLFLLATLLGKAPADYPREIEACATLPVLARPLPVGDGAALLRRRPDIRQAERSIAGDTARIGVAIADLYRSVSVGGGILAGGKVENVGSSHSFGFGFGPLVSWNFPSRPIVKARIAAAQEQVAEDLARFDAVVLEALRGTETALATYARNRDRAAALDRAARSAEASAAQADKLFRFGRSDFLPVLSAQATLAVAQVQRAAAQSELVDDQIAIFLALGGGWQ